MSLEKIVYKIQYQIAKIEVVELMIQYSKNNQPSLELEVSYSMISTLRQNLLNATEVCLNPSIDTLHLQINSLQKTLISANNLLIQISIGMNSTDIGSLFLQELLTNIVSHFVSLNTELGKIASQLTQLTQQSSDNYNSVEANFIVTGNVIDQNFKNLVNKCMGDIKQAERLIQYECNQNSSLNREEAIRFAIMRWERDSR